MRTQPLTTTALGQLPARVDLMVYQGDDFFVTVAVDDSTTPIDLTTYTAKAEIRSAAGSPTILATFTTTILNALTVGLHLPHAQSELLTSNGAWDVQITDTAGQVTTLAYGSVSVVKQVTRS